MKPHSSKATRRGFSLIELTAVIGIISVLAAIAIYSVRKYIQHAKSSEAAEIISAIKAGEEAYFDETFQYLQLGNGANDYYPDTPTGAPGTFKVQWGSANGASGCTACGTRYKVLGVLPSAPVLFRYSVAIGAAGTNPATGKATLVVNSPFAAMTAAPQAYYVVNAVSDLDGNGASQPMTAFVGSNLQGDLHSENIGN